MIFTKDLQGNETHKAFYPNCRRISYKTDLKNKDRQSLLIFHRSKKATLFYSFFYDEDIVLSKNVNTLSIDVSPIFTSNGIFLDKIAHNSLFLKNCLLHTPNYQCSDIQIKRLAQDITKGCIFPYGKVKAIHDWVAANIYYDRDSLINDKYIQLDKSALGVYVAKKGVCSGYSNLTTALLRAVGIPSIGVLCFTLHIDTQGGWHDKHNLTHEPNHILTLAFVNSRWVIMDVTWDSDNVFEHGCFRNKTGLGVSNKYFDVTIPFISSTHKFVQFIY